MSIVKVALPVPLLQVFDYSCSIDGVGIGSCVSVPFGRHQQHGVVIAVAEHSDTPLERLRAVTSVHGPQLPAEWLELVHFLCAYYQAPLGEGVACALPALIRRGEVGEARDPDPWLDLGELAHAQGPGRSAIKRRLHDRLAAGPCARSVLLAEGIARHDLTSLLRAGWLVEVPRRDVGLARPGPTLQPEQAAAVDAVVAAHGGFAPFLLHGVTGSGKTEVYLQCMSHVLGAGGQVLLLVPEIGLTPQLEERVRMRFPHAEVAALHSGVADKARARAYLRALAGHADIVVGTRLAVLTPMPRLQLIIVDEEHDPSYKQQEGVLYHARDLAVWRAHQRGVPVVLGSATPSLESEANARNGRYRSLRLSRRATDVVLPVMELVDCSRIVLQDGLSPALLAALADNLDRGEQSLVFLNRRGYAPVLACSACGWFAACQACSTRLVVHLGDRRLRCHHCGHAEPIPPHCPQCRNVDIQAFGRGTQRLEDTLRQRFPQARILRVDRDSAGTPQRWQALLADIRAGAADILVGTQMMAKGHDFPALTLVGVLGADSSLYAADFRAAERLFQQLTQVAGRAGRGERPGRVLIQTEFPGHPLYGHIARHDTDACCDMLLAERQAAGFPPFGFQALLRADSKQLVDAENFLRLAKGMAPVLAGVFVHDPVPMRMVRLAARERAQLLIEAGQRRLLQAFLQDWIPRLYGIRGATDVRWQVDVDPLEI